MKRNGFTLIEMLVVLAILTVLMGVGIGGYAHMVAAAKRAKTQELVSNTATALAAIYVSEGLWPKALRVNGGGDGQLDAATALPLAIKNQMSLVMNQAGDQLGGSDRFGLITPQAMEVVKAKGKSATLATKVTPETTIQDHILHYAIDLDGDGITVANVGGQRVRIRTSAAVWAIGLKGGKNGQGTPWSYDEGLKRDAVYSWVVGQTKGF